VGNEENEHPAPDPTITVINITSEPSGVHKKISQRVNYG
jgi:hypothetical protein